MSELLKPPAVPAAILNFFASQPDFPAVAGDISEEFHQRARNSSAKAALRWYWREAFRNSVALTRRELMWTPLRTTLIALSCLLAVNVLTSLLWRLLLLSAPSPWGVFTIDLMTLLVMGLVGGRLLPGREWALALTLGVIFVCFSVSNLILVRKVVVPVPFWEIIIVGKLLRLSAFWLGCLWIRVHSRSFAATSVTASTPRSSPPRNPPDLW
jgi:hypothetical protein